MSSESSTSESDDSDEYRDPEPPRKKIKIIIRRPKPTLTDELLKGFEALISQVRPGHDDWDSEYFEEYIEELLPDYLSDRDQILAAQTEKDDDGLTVRPLTKAENVAVQRQLAEQRLSLVPVYESVALRKLKVEQERRKTSVRPPSINISSSPGLLEPLQTSESVPISGQVLDALCSIRTTPFESSFLARLLGTPQQQISGAFLVDWETVTPWMAAMADVREHHRLRHPDRCQPVEARLPIVYTYLQPRYLDQVHDLLVRSFWAGVNVADSLDYSPERCTVVAVHGKMVVGVAIISSPRETYITYLAVRHGWENAQIATKMLYQLIVLNPHKDITLHVSANNPAMLLYNRFGFKAEEFVAGFYEAYLDPNSRASMNAFRLRLRHQPS